jgi:ribonuclease P protein component
MLPKVNRLRLEKHFQNVFNGGKMMENRFFRVKFLKNRNKYTRFGFIVGIKFSKKATQRNFIKRRLRAAIRLFLRNIKPGFDIIIWPKVSVKDAKYRELTENLKNLLSKNDIISL